MRAYLPISCVGTTALCLLVIASGWSKEPTADDLRRGQELYEQHCLECHGKEGHGDGPRAPFLAPKPGNLVSAAISAKSDEELLRIIANGQPRTAMKGWKEILSADDQQKVLAYLRSFIHFQPRPLNPPPVQNPK